MTFDLFLLIIFGLGILSLIGMFLWSLRSGEPLRLSFFLGLMAILIFVYLGMYGCYLLAPSPDQLRNR